MAICLRSTEVVSQARYLLAILLVKAETLLLLETGEKHKDALKLISWMSSLSLCIAWEQWLLTFWR
jgi:hypothetical protein